MASSAPTKAQIGLCANRLCRVGIEPDQERCPTCAKEWAKRSAPCAGCGNNFTRKTDQPKAKFCCKACWRASITRLRTGVPRPKRTGADAIRFRPHGARTAKLLEDACRCADCKGRRDHLPTSRAELVARTAREMGVPVSPLAGIPSTTGPLTQEQFQAKWDAINAAKREENRLRTWTP